METKRTKIAEDSIVKLIIEDLKEINIIIDKLNKNEDEIFYLLRKIRKEVNYEENQKTR